MAINNNSISVFKSNYELKSKIKERNKAIENKEIKQMTKKEFQEYLDLLTNGTKYIEKSNEIIINKSKNVWSYKEAGKNYKEVNNKLSKLNELGFYDIISSKNQNAHEMLKSTLEFNNLNKEIVLSEQRGGVINESIHSFKQAYEYLDKLKNEATSTNQRSLFAFDLETTGGKNLNGVWEPDSITEFSLQEWDLAKGERVKNHTMLVGLTKEEGEKRLKEIEQAITDGTLKSNEKLRVSAMRYSMYGNNKTTKELDEITGLYKIKNFVDSNEAEMFNIDKIKKGIQLHVDAGEYYKKNNINGIRRDHYYMGTAMNDLMSKINNSTASLAGQNHLGHDIPIMQNQLLQWHNMYKDKTNMFNIDMEMPSHKTIDLLGGSRAFIEYKGVGQLYPGDGMIGSKKVAGQEYMAQIHLGKWFKENNIQAHKAEDDVLALLGLFTQKSDILEGNTSVLDHIYKGLENVKTTDTLLDTNTHILRAKKRASSFGGKGYINFAMDSQNTVYTASDHIIGSKDGVSKALNGATHENFNVGFGVNKGGFYEINKIQKVGLNDELRGMLGDLAPEYSGKNLFHVQLSMAVTDNFKDSRLGDLKQNFFFKNEKELQGFLSSNFDVVANKTKNGIEIVKEHFDKFDIRELQNVKGEARFVDVDKNWMKNQKEAYDNALDFSANKILTSRAENALLRDAPYEKMKKALDLEKELLGFLEENNIKKNKLSQREINQIMSGKIASGKMAMNLDEERIGKAQDIINKALSYTKKINGTEISRTLDSSIDNYSSIMSFIGNNKTVLNNIKSVIEEKAGDQSNTYKQELFARTYDAVKKEVAEHIYRNSDNTASAETMGILNNKRLKASVHEFKNTYELDLSSIVKDSKFNYISLENPEHLSNVHKFDISSKSPMYSMIDKATNAVFGKGYKNITDAHKQVATEELFSMLNKEDELLKGTKAFKNLRKTFEYKNGKFNKDVNFLNIADTIVEAMQEVKAKDKFAGIINTKHTFMKSLEGHESFVNALNSENVQKKIAGITENIMNDLKVNVITASLKTDDLNKQIETIVDNSLMKHYAPSLERVQAAAGWDSRKEMLYNKGTKDIREYLVDTIKGFSFIKDTEISIQNDGALLISNGGRDPIILKDLPKIKLDDDSGVMYLQVGNQKLQFNKKAILNSDRNHIKGDIGTNISQINKHSNSRFINKVVENKGVNEGIDSMLSKISYDMKNLRQGPTINNFGGNDIDSNFNVDLSEIKNVLKDLFAEDGNFKHYLNDTTFVDKNLQETLKKKLARASFNEKGQLKDLSPDITRDIVKDAFHILDVIKKNGNVSSDFIEVLDNTLGFTGQEKKVSNFIAYEGIDRPTNSTYGAFDNTQRPPITQSGNAKFLRVEEFEKAKSGKANVIAGNIISSASTDRKTMREFAGVGKATTDVMLDTYYVSTNALKVLIDSNFDDVISKSTVDFKTEDAARNTYAYIRDSISTFEQERIMDSRTHESIYGLQTAATHKLSKGTDISSIIKDLEGEDLQKQMQLIAKHRGDFKIINNELKFESSIGTYVKRGEGTIKSKGFANLTSSFSSKVQDGIFNFNYYNSNGMKLKDKEINKIIKENKNSFMSEGKFVDSNKFSAILGNILEEKGIYGQYAIEDMAALGYAKTMTSGAEKGMTDILYATTGKYNKDVKTVFENIQMWENVKSKVLTEEAVDALVLKSKDNSYLKSVFAGTSFNTIDDLKDAMRKERHMHSNMLFNYGLGNKTHLIANDNIVGHANFGAMYQGSLSKAIDLLSSNKDIDGMNGAVQTIVDMMNNNKEYQFMENWDLSGKKLNTSAIGVKNVNGRLIINQEFLTQNDNLSNLNSTKFNNLMKAIDEKYLDNGKDSDSRLVRKNVYTLEVNADGIEEFKPVKEVVGSFYSRQIKGKTVLLGTQTKENTKYVTDVETQTGVTDEYFTLKKQATELKKEKIKLESEINSTNDLTIKTKLDKDLLKVKNELNDTQEFLSSYEGTVKIMKFGDQELSIVNRIAVTQSHIDQINELIDKGEANTNIADSLSLKGRLHVDATGRVLGSNDLELGNMLKNGEQPVQGEGYRALDWFTSKMKDQQWFDEIKDVKLEKEFLDMDQYKHLKDVFEHFDAKGQAVGVEKAQEVWQARMALAAKEFNKNDKGQSRIDDLINKGFKQKHINDIALDIDRMPTENILIDLGEEFSSNPSSRYIAMPGTGKMVMDEEISKNSHKKFIALKHRYDEYMSMIGNGKEETDRLFTSIKSLSDDIMTNIDKELFNKNGILHNMSKVELTVPSYRNKLSGFVGSHFDESLLSTPGSNTSFINSLASNITNKAMIDGKSIAELERNGQYYDYKFISREQFKNMGYFENDKLKQFGFDNVKQMEEHLQTHGSIDMFDRYPNTRTGSIAPSHIFLDNNLQGNQSKVSIPLAMKANADNDGDSGSNFLLRYTDKHGREIDGSYYHRVKSIAIDNLNSQGLEINANSIAQAAEATGMIEKEDFENFHKLQAQMSITSQSDNIKWANKGKQIITKDNIKNLKIGDLTNASMVEDAYSDFLGTNVVTRLSQMPTLNDFYNTEQSANEMIKKAQELDKAHGLSSDILKNNSESEMKSWDSFSKISDIRMSDSSESMDKSLAILENATKKGLVDEEYLKSAKVTAIKKISHDKYSQEMLAKTGLAATGNVNLALNSIKLATQFTEEDPSKIRFTNFIWDGLDVAEQGIISEKKRKIAGYDDTRIEGFTEAIGNIFNSGSKRNPDLGKKQLGDWMDTNGGSVFETAYDEMGKYLLGSKNFKSMSKEEGIKEVKNQFLNFVEKKSEDGKFMSVMASLDAIGRNSSHDYNIERGKASASWGLSLKSNTMDAVKLTNESSAKAILEDEASKIAYEERKTLSQIDLDESLKSVTKGAKSEASETIMKHMPKINLGGGSGLGMAMLGTAAGLLVSGYASGNPLKDKQASQVASQEQASQKQTMSVPQFMDQGGMVTSGGQGGYVINLQADTKKGRKYMQRMMSQAAEASVGGAVSVNMNLRDVSQNGITDKDIEDFMNRHL